MSDERIDIPVGTVVQLKSGGPLMTVESKDASTFNSVVCVWFQDNQRRVSAFNTATLEIYKDDEPNVSVI